jgi:hypothetical protein
LLEVGAFMRATSAHGSDASKSLEQQAMYILNPEERKPSLKRGFSRE